MDTVDYKALGKRIREYRLKNELTQESLAALAEVGVSHISNLETGNGVPSLPSLVSIANALHVTTDALLCDSLAEAKSVYEHQSLKLLQDCDELETRFLTELLKSAKEIYRNDKCRRNQ